MPRKLEVHWHKPRRCWRKYRDGTYYYLAKRQCKGKWDVAGYKIALAEWRRWEAWLAPPVPTADDPNIEPPEAVIKAMQNLLRFQRGRNLRGQNWADDPIYLQALQDVRAMPDTPAPSKPPATATTLRALLDEYLSTAVRHKLAAGAIGPKACGDYKAKLEPFMAFCLIRGVERADQIDNALMEAYRGEQLAKSLSPSTITKRLGTVANFVRWMYGNKHIKELPQAFQLDYSYMKQNKVKPKFFTVEECQQLFRAAPTNRDRLYVCLGLNCGFTEIDVATLRHEHIDWTEGRIQRQRHKTEVFQEHKLWGITKQLLRAEMTNPHKSELALLRPDGQPLVRNYLTSKGTASGTDHIAYRFRLVKKAAKMADNPRGFKIFRKTVADELTKHFPQYPALQDVYLANGEAVVIRRAYAGRHFESLDEALDYAEELFGLADLPAIVPDPAPPQSDAVPPA